MTRLPAAIGWLALALSCGAIAACGDDGGVQGGRTPPPPATTGPNSGLSTSTSGGDSTGAASPCDFEADPRCPADQFCAADYALGDPAPEQADFICRNTCVPTGAVSSWCSGDASCCEGVCRKDGLCEGPMAPTSTGSSSSGGSTSGTGDPSSGTDSTGGSSSGSSSG